MFLAEEADERGTTSLRSIAERFQSFFIDRAAHGKAEENPNVVEPGVLANRTLSAWERTLVEQPLHYISPALIIREGNQVAWAPRVMPNWDEQLRSEIRRTAFERLARYYERNVPGGY
jgi:hypothetical protein